MRLNSRLRRSLVLVICVMALAASSAARAADDADARIDAFVESLKQNELLSEALRQSLIDHVAQQRAIPDAKVDTITDALRAEYPKFAEGLTLLAEEDLPKARAAFAELSKSNDAFLAAHSTYFLARACTLDGDFDQAKPLLTELTTGKHAHRTLYDGESLFFLAVSQAELLDRDGATKTLGQFLRDYPQAPERMRVGALHLLNDLATIDKGSIIDVHDRMDFIHRRIEHKDTGERPQTEQKTVVSMLDKLIEEAEKKEQQGGGGGGGGSGGGNGSPSGNNAPSSPAQSSTAPIGESRLGDMHRINKGRPGDTWGSMKQRERDRVFNAIKGQFPERYKELVEQYYKSLQDEKAK